MKHVAYVFSILLAVALISVGANAQVVMNEIYSRGVAGNLDWIELYNAGSTTVDISAYKIYDSGGDAGSKPKKPFPAGTTIPAKGFYVIIVDTASFAGDLSGFGLSSAGEKVWLTDSTTGAIIDTITFGAMGTTQSVGRGPDGGAWTLLNSITRGASNGKLVMNEIYSRGVAGNLDWIEVYNGTSGTINLGDYRIYDSGGDANTKPKKAFPASATIAAGGFYVIITDTADFDGDLSGFGLSSGGEKVWLQDTVRSVLVDTVTFGAMSTTQTWGRTPDGGAWSLLNTITRGTTNGGATSVETGEGVAIDFALAQNYPNPFNPATTIRVSIARESNIRLTVFNLLGQPVATLAEQRMNPGTYTFAFDASHLPSGVYVYRLEAGSTQLTRTMMLLK